MRVRNEFPDFSGQSQALAKALRALPRIVGNIAVNFYKDRFSRQGWQDERFEPWTKRKREDRRARAILVKTGRLRRSIRIVSQTHNSVTVGTSVPYAQIHNEGGTIKANQSVKSHTRKGHKRKKDEKLITVKSHPVKAHSRTISTTIPKRQFMGASALLIRRIVMQVNKGLAKILNQ